MENLEDVIGYAGYLVWTLKYIVAVIILIVFLWGLSRFVLHAGNEEARQEGRRYMFWAVIALFVAFAIWGIIYFIGDSLGIYQGGAMNQSTF